tara:strand:+ start:955 stop:1968 length:1014 start_codon:yes stop_codon:yes gene_type:complete
MNFISKNFNEKNLLLLISFFLIIFIFINFTHKHFESFTIKDDNSYSRLTNIEFKNNINKNLTSDPVYETILTKKCEITGNMHDRHKVRWIKFLLLKNIFQVSEKLNSNSPYYVNILLHSLLIFFSIIFLNWTFELKKIHIIFFLLYVTFIFQNYLGEYSFSVFEMFFASCAIWASKKKNIILFFFIILLSVLNRESGIILILTWLLFNNEFKKIVILSILVLAVFLIINYETINCIINPKFFIPLEKQQGQLNLSDLSSVNIFSLLKTIIINFLIPFGLIFYAIIKNNIKNKFLIIMTIIYLFVFLFATPVHHMAVKLIILPLIILSFNLPSKKIIN